MAVSITTSPEFPTTRAPVRVRFALTAGNYVRVWCTDAPLGSALKTELVSSQQARIHVFNGGAAETWEFKADKGGAYIFAAQEITRGASAYGGGYKGDPNANPSETLLGETEITLRFGQRLEMTVGTRGDTATLAFWIWAGTIRATTQDQQGEVTPALFEPKSERAGLAAASAGVTDALAALVGVTASTALGTLSARLNEMIDDFNAHRAQAGVHASNDTHNTISSSFRNASNEESLKRSAAELVLKLDRHMRNDNAGAGTGSAAYHSAADMTNTMIAGAPGTLAQVLSTLADVWRVYEAHRVQSGVHSSNDTTNTLAALPALLDVHRAFLSHVSAPAPAAPVTANAGVVTLVHGAGMKESS